jgi:hypothetical protein
MNIDYKYIGKPYTLEELVTGNSIFKINYDYLYGIREWDKKYNTDENDEIEDFDYTAKEHLELLFNEFLNIISLLLYDEATYHETLKMITLKTEEFEMFGVLTGCIPFILDEHSFSYDSNILEKLKICLVGDSKSETPPLNLSKEAKKFLSPITKKHTKEMNNALTSDNIHDLTLFFDKYHDNSISEIVSILNPNRKRIVDKINISDSYITSKSQEVLDASQKVLLIEELIRSDKWGNATDRKKAEIISQIIDRNPDNIRRTLSEINKPLSSTSTKFREDLLKAQKTIKLLG